MKKYDELINEAMEMLRNDDELFCNMVDELDSWNGFADGFRVYPMYELNELFDGVSLTEFLDKLSDHFNTGDEYFVDTIWGLKSIDDKYSEYLDNTDEGEVLDNVLENWNHLYFSDSDFEDLVKEIIEAREDARAEV